MFNKTAFPLMQYEMVVFAGIILGYITVPANKLRLAIVDGKLTTTTTNVEALVEFWEKNGDPNLHTTIVTKQLNDGIKLVKENFTSIFDDIKDATYNTTDRETFRMYERAIGSPIPVADYCPVFIIKSVAFLTLKLMFINTATPNRRAFPKGNKIFFEYYIGIDGLTVGNIPFANAVNISSAFYTLQFLETDIRKTVYMHCYYENAHGHRSPVSTTISKVIA